MLTAMINLPKLGTAGESRMFSISRSKREMGQNEIKKIGSKDVPLKTYSKEFKKTKFYDDYVDIDLSKLSSSHPGVNDKTINSERQKMESVIKLMSREDLEEFVYIKLVEVLVKHSEVGKFQKELIHVQKQKNNLQQRVEQLQKQVLQLTKGFELLLRIQEAQKKDDISSGKYQKMMPPPLKFYRSVQLQVNINPTVNVNTNLTNIKPTLKPLPNTNEDVTIKQNVANAVAIKPNVANSNIVNCTDVEKITKPSTPLILNNPKSNVEIVDLTDDGPIETTAKDANANEKESLRFQYKLFTTTDRKKSVLIARKVEKEVSLNIVQNSEKDCSPSVARDDETGKKVTVSNTTNSKFTSKALCLSNELALPKFQLPALPRPPLVPNWNGADGSNGVIMKSMPPKPILMLKLNPGDDGIVLSWNLNLTLETAEILSYQIYAHQESPHQNQQNKSSQWRKVGDVKALPLPMACTLSQFSVGNRYYFIVRAIDKFGRCGEFCKPMDIVLDGKSNF